MNIEKNLILIKDKDQTKDISYCKYNNGKWTVTYNAGKTYNYGYNSVVWLRDPKELNVQSTLIYQLGKAITGAVKILVFDQYIKVIFKNGYTKVFHESEVKIEETCLNNKKSSNTFDYLKEVASAIKIDDETILGKQYEKMSFISPSSVLSKYLHGKDVDKFDNIEKFIYPFGFNISQKYATEKAINNQISIIEGPPGTGKTQTILNIISNAIINNKTVAVVSNNNSATSNVVEKLEKYGVDFIAAFLGNSDNKKQFIENQTGLYPTMEGWKLESIEEESLKLKLVESEKTLNDMLKKKNRYAKLKEELENLSLENKYFLDQYKNNDIDMYSSFYNQSSDKILALWINYEYHLRAKAGFGFFDKFKYLIKFGIYSFRFYDNSSEKVVSLLQNLYYKKRLKEISSEITLIEKNLEKYKFEDKMKEFSDFSMKLFKSNLYKRRGKYIERIKFDKSDLWKNFDEVVKEYPVVLSTTHSLRNSIGENYLFDYVIIDESSQVDIVSGALALSCGKNAVIVGDEKQLSNVVPENVRVLTNEIYSKYKLNNAYSYADNSLLTSIKKLYPNAAYTLLKEHYRCNPKIIGFCNQKFYNNELIALTEENCETPLVVYKTKKGNHARGKYNQREIDVVFEEVIPEQNLKNTNESIGIISPYRMQANEIKNKIGDLNIEADTVHKFQGREKDNIIISTVSNEMNDFIDDANLINVAVSRAVNKLILVVSGNNEFLNKNSNIGDLIKYISYNNFEINESKISSVFDLLYKGYNEKRRELLKNTNKSEYDSENLMANLIDEILKDDKYSSISYVMHEPLSLLIKDMSLLNDREKSFVVNIHTHTDFILFNKLDKAPILVVEVDGYAFHENNERQKERDAVKDSILGKYNIPIIRVKTNGSGEEDIIRNKLNEILLII